MDGGDAVLVGELAHKTKPADTASETSSLPEQKGFRGFVLLDTQDFTGEPIFVYIFNYHFCFHILASLRWQAAKPSGA